MGAGRALLHPAHVKLRRGKLDLIPLQVNKLGDTQPVPVGHEGHRRVPVTPTVLPGGVHQPLDLGRGLGQVFTSA